MFRPFNGSSLALRCSTTCPNEEDSVCNKVVSEVTSTTSLAAPTARDASTRVSSCTCTTTSGCEKRLKPAFSTSTRYAPGITFTKEYVPWSLVVCVCFSDVPVLVRVTVAPSTAAPEGSVTDPVTDPYVLCPNPKAEQRMTRLSEIASFPQLRNRTKRIRAPSEN